MNEVIIMDNNTLIEQVVPKERTAKYGLKIALIITLAVGIPTAFIVAALITRIAYLAIIGMFLYLFAAYGAWYFITSLKVEYEYAFLSSTLRIDKVIAKRRRRAILKVDVKKFDDFFRYDDKKMSERRFNKIYHVSGKEFSENNYVACFHHEGKGKCAIIFTPNEKLLEGMKPFFTSELRKKLFLNKEL